jgi:hypothetical protein
MDAQLLRLVSDPIFRHGDALTIGYLVALRGYDKPTAMEGVREDAYHQGFELGLKDRESRKVLQFIGFYPDELLPLKRGQTVTIPKGVTITHRGQKVVNERKRTVKVDHLLNGTNLHMNPRQGLSSITPPTVRWPGKGGYWSEVDINVIPEAQEAVKEAQRQASLDKTVLLVDQLVGTFDKIRKSATAHTALVPKEGFHFRFRSDNNSLQMEAVAEDHTTIASLSVEARYSARQITLMINVTSTICQALPNARLIFRALSLVMSTAEKIDAEYCQPWNQQ